jgi:competence protein ComEA
MLTKFTRIIQATFGVSSKEARGFILLLPFMALLIFSQPLYHWLLVGNAPMTITETILVDSLITMARVAKSNRVDSIALETFDPNQATITQLQNLGIAPHIAKRIDTYRTKGGKFRVKADLKRIYGFDSALFLQLIPFIELPDVLPIVTQAPSPTRKPVVVIEYDLNKADTADFKSVRGIGTVIAGRILKYRNSLGGFIKREQLHEVYGLDSAIVAQMREFYVATDFSPSSLNLNQATLAELDQHPYLTYKQAKAIVTYRAQHGAFKSADDLRAIQTLPETIRQKITPYLMFQ